jgi:uncharacterized membrane protein YkvA (DUF1232 family)
MRIGSARTLRGAPRLSRPSLAHRIRELGHQMAVGAHALWLAARDPRTPLAARLLALLIAAYALSPVDLVPDFIPVLGWIDDLLIIPAGIWLVRQLIPDALYAELVLAAATAKARPTSRIGLAIVISLWAMVLWLIYWAVRTSPYY